MDIRFQYEERTTRIHFHADRASLIFALKALVLDECGLVFLDKGLGKIWKQKIIGFGIPAKQIVVLKDGERSKEWGLIGTALELLSKRAHERKSPLIVIGGGAACDAGALVASLYRRGVPLVLVPTTLLAMVDAAIGGKTAVDLQREGALYKNVAGSFYPANLVHFWPGWLDSLSERERLSGAGELLKTLWLDGDDFDLAQLRSWTRAEAKTEKIWPLVERAVHIKAKIVQADPNDTKGIRNSLNYGHTLGHVFESIGNGKIAHGEAVAWGMWAETAFLKEQKAFAGKLRDRLEGLGFAVPKFLRGLQAGEIISFLRADKKMQGGKIEMSVLRDFGKIERVAAHPHELAKFTAHISNEI